jgi:ATP-GRASP peptide maturase of grasp-with-spasm system
LVVLRYATELGIAIPETLVTNDLLCTERFIEKSGGSVITKAISDGIYHFAQDNAYYSYTEKIDETELKQLNRDWFHSLFQSQIVKDIEIRSFFFDDKFYSMAIFSQRNAQTEVDFRKYDAVKPNRTVPYQLPVQMEDRLRKLFRKLQLNTGSVDLILDKSGEYFFLEINPVGQFGMVSYPCNYQLEKKVAKHLMYESERQTH